MRNVGPCLLAIASLLCAAPARAADPDLPAIDPKGQVRVMTHDDATSTSKCVGNPVTPLCAVETIIACFERQDGELCRTGMGIDERRYFKGAKPQPQPYLFANYRVVATQRFGSENPPPHWYTSKHRDDWRGDVEIVLLKQDCWRDPPKCTPVHSTNRFTYVVRRAGNRWKVMTWRTPDPRFEEITPEDF